MKDNEFIVLPTYTYPSMNEEGKFEKKMLDIFSNPLNILMLLLYKKHPVYLSNSNSSKKIQNIKNHKRNNNKKINISLNTIC